MSLIPYDPFHYLREIQKEMDQMFGASKESMSGFSIRLEETDDEIIAVCSAPGLTSEDEMEINLRGRILTVGRKVSSSLEVKGEKIYKSEQYWSRFEQTVPLPCRVDGWRTALINGEFKIYLKKIKG